MQKELSAVIRFLFVPLLVLLSGSGKELLASSADEGENPKLILISLVSCCPEQAWPEAEKSVLEEMAALDLQVVVLEANPQFAIDNQEQLSRLAAENNAVSALRITKDPIGNRGEAALWIGGQEQHEPVFRRYTADNIGDVKNVTTVLSLKIVEAIRASLLDLPPREPESQDQPDDTGPQEPPQPTPETEEELSDTSKPETEKPPPRLGIGVGALVFGSPEGDGVIGGLDLNLSLMAVYFLAVELDGSISLFGRDIKRDMLDATIDMSFVRLWALWEILQKGYLRPALGLGGGLVISWTRGAGSQAYDAKYDTEIVTYLGAVTRVGIVIIRHLWVRLGLRVGVFIPEVEIVFAEHAVAGWGRPLIEGFLHLEARFW